MFQLAIQSQASFVLNNNNKSLPTKTICWLVNNKSDIWLTLFLASEQQKVTNELLC